MFMNIFIVLRKSSVDRDVTKSKYTALVVRQVNRGPYLLFFSVSTEVNFH